ncbi:hypothetical protein MHBO_003516 [Bonamia ostreae]|uniref:Uncharacterized protein n=1 Tax=Bonamia ostreae TaxID=126728 RepID=A0ABV2AQP2_9EUKA
MSCLVISCVLTMFASKISYQRHWDTKHNTSSFTVLSCPAVLPVVVGLTLDITYVCCIISSTIR